MSTLPTPLRKLLEGTITEARELAERGARKALQALAVHEADPYPHMNDTQRELRRKLQAQARQLGDRESLTRPGMYETKHLAEKLAYDQWHRLLFGRYLVENNLLISPEHEVAVTLQDCEELAPSLGLNDAWAVAARFAAKELPEIFRADDPAGEVELPVEDRNPLIQLVTALPVEVFTAADSLGWCYQFWQAKEKERVNKSEKKIGADELPAVTQLFTEDYMVDFLLDNTLGAWHAGKVLAANPELAERAGSEDELRDAVSLPACPWKYLRFIRSDDGKWTPAAGTFDGWPKAAKDLKCLDPCMGSGHFIVAMFERLMSLRIGDEGTGDETAAAGVIRDNLFGLEIDPRCAQIAAFNLALAAWRRVGHHFAPPSMNLACSGLAPNAKKEDWLRVAGDSDRLGRGMERLYALFKDAPILGSLINPHLYTEDMHVADYHELQPLLEIALECEVEDVGAHELAVTARGVAKAAEILAGKFVLAATNVPYLGRPKQDDTLRDHCGRVYPDSKADLATSFLERCLDLCVSNGTAVLVTPQNWLYLGAYSKLRERLLASFSWNVTVKLGPNAFRDMNWWAATTALVIITRVTPGGDHSLVGLDTSTDKRQPVKSAMLRGDAPCPLRILSQRQQQLNPDARIITSAASNLPLLRDYAAGVQGLATHDDPQFAFLFWEFPALTDQWTPLCNTVESTIDFGGRSYVFPWRGGTGRYAENAAALKREGRLGGWKSGREAWGRNGVSIKQMGQLPATRYIGEMFDHNSAVIVPKDDSHLAAIWCFCSSPDFRELVREVDQKVNVTNSTLVKVPFDLSHWQRVAAETYPNGLPKPFSSDPTQWLFDGHPNGSDQPLHVAVARLIGYLWPRQTGFRFPDCPALGPDGLETLADADGIVCLSATKGEVPASERLRALLAQALGEFDLKSLLAGSGPKSSKSETLEEWLRDEFFEQHCALFHHRPFIWHIWDGHKSGFSALVNYHKLDRGNLEKLTYSYLGDWIRRQQAAVEAGEAGSDTRLEAAKRLQERLKLILEGELPFDLFVRWKPLSQQTIGWHPDLNDGVRMNIRPFLAKNIPGGKKGAGILRTKPNIKWDKDRGKEPVRDKKEFPWFWGWDGETIDFKGVGTTPDGNRWNDLHYTNAAKLAARASKP
jgi:hypothetical protein